MPGQKHLFQRRGAEPLSFSMSAQNCAHIFHPCRFPVSYGSLRVLSISPQNITMHIGNAYKEGELARDSTCKEYLQVQQEGKRKVSRIVKYYDLDVIISVGYRVKSKRGGFTLEELSPVTCPLGACDASRLKNCQLNKL